MNHPLSTTYEKFYWDTPYTGTDNLTYTNELWEAIHPSHGMVALDRNWAREHHLPDSMYLPDDHSKGVYLLESYHYLHCLVSWNSVTQSNVTDEVDCSKFFARPSLKL